MANQQTVNVSNATDTGLVCYSPTWITTNGIWQGDNPLHYSFPLFTIQLTLVVVATRVLTFLLRPLRQPRVIAEIIGGIILGPSVLGRNKNFASSIFPLHSVTVLETIANIGLVYFLFIVGLEMDINVIRRTRAKALLIAGAGMVIPFVIGISSSFLLKESVSENVSQVTFLLFLSVGLSITAFPVLARILAELKLLNTELGRLAMSAAIINDVCAWVLLALAIAVNDRDKNALASVWVVLSGVVFVLFSLLVLRPAVTWVTRKTTEGEAVSEIYICAIMLGVMVCAFTTDIIGIHPVFGAFMFGLVIPNGSLGGALIEKLEDFTSGLLLPLFFAISGLRTNVMTITNEDTWAILMLVIVLACAGKVVGTLVVALFMKMTPREGIALGLLMNTKGLIEMIVLNIGMDKKVLDESSFAIMVIAAVIMTGMITPVVTTIYKPARRFLPYKRRTVEKGKPESLLRMLVCVHTSRNVPTIINLLEASHATKKSPISVHALHLVELTGRSSAMIIVHSSRKSGRHMNRTEAESEHIVNAFENYVGVSGVAVQLVTAMSPFATMHEDICNLAEEKRAALIILPFHKHQTVDGGLETTNPAFRTINQNVLVNAPCSVGILIDRGLGGTTGISASHVCHHLAVLFFGGPDDREALAYASRMAEHPGVSLTVVRFLPGDEAVEPEFPVADTLYQDDSKNLRILTVLTDNDREHHLDDGYIAEFRLRTVGDESIMYTEKVVNNVEESIAAIRSMDSIHDLFVVGRAQRVSSLTTGLTDWSECPELGPIGDLLASSDFAATVSVLIMQQYVGVLPQEVVGTPNSPQREPYLHNVSHRNSAVVQDMPQIGGGFTANWTTANATSHGQGSPF
ncbi:hypothetical protein AMTRI_Chr10g225100 [Amborella trichopoda]|uniref:Uncharacterized protein n=1 Tax=Amborella trichopoda TaxID=13333 RepID=W1NS88_AMBTC|nr:cation/H(+) antiporter 15 [Amborella trichopoda]ERM99916.1 hypothetical protein AMTR_s00110p00080970 [Amborella trichopoda]|eukprot:XP_006837063.1 cation/H(+) antiporter 15 [Amborella trichopoda]